MMIVMDQVRVDGAWATDVCAWPVTAQLSSVGVWQQGLSIHTEGTDSWGKVDIAGKDSADDDQRATLWVGLRVDGQWWITGAERLRPAQLNGVKPMGDPSIPDTLAVLIGQGWLYDRNRWPRLGGRNPQPGDPVAVMVVSGSTRSDETYATVGGRMVRERTQLMVIAWPDRSGANPCRVLWTESDPGPIQSPVPPLQPDASVPMPVAASTIAAVASLEMSVRALATDVDAIKGKVQQIEPVLLDSTTAAIRLMLMTELKAIEQRLGRVEALAAQRPTHVMVFGRRVPVTFE